MVPLDFVKRRLEQKLIFFCLNVTKTLKKHKCNDILNPFYLKIQNLKSII